MTSVAPDEVVSPHCALKPALECGASGALTGVREVGIAGVLRAGKGRHDGALHDPAQRRVRAAEVVATRCVSRICGSQFQRLPDPEKSGMPIAATLIGVSRETSGTSEPTMRSVRDQRSVAVVVRSRGSGKRRRSPGPF